MYKPIFFRRKVSNRFTVSKDDGRLCFHKSLSVNRGVPTLAGWGVPTLAEGVPTLEQGGTYLAWGYISWPESTYFGWGRYLSCPTGTYPGWRGTYHGWGNVPTLDWVPQSAWIGEPPPRQASWGYTFPQETEQHSEYLLCGGRYASCVHARGLCFFVFCK